MLQLLKHILNLCFATKDLTRKKHAAQNETGRLRHRLQALDLARAYVVNQSFRAVQQRCLADGAVQRRESGETGGGSSSPGAADLSRLSEPCICVPDLKSTVPDLNSRVSDSKSGIPEFNSRIPDLKSLVPDLNSRVADLKSRIQDFNSRVPDIQSGTQNLRF
jgi:hypothetical protein